MFAEYFNNKEYAKFKKIILKLNLALIGCTVLAEIACYLIGIPVLNLLYKVDLSQYKMHLMLMVLSGLFYAMSTIMFYLLGTIRKQKYTTYVYAITSVFALFISYTFVKQNAITGAVLSNVMIMFALLIGLTATFLYHYKKRTTVA